MFWSEHIPAVRSRSFHYSNAKVNDDKTNWVKKELTDSSSPVTDVKFAPRTWSDLMMPGRCGKYSRFC